MALPTDVEKLPAGGGVNRPDSGTYGEKADLNRLRQQLPSSGAPAPGQPGPPSMPSPGRGTVPQPVGRPPQGPAGVPSVLMSPGTAGRPVGTPLDRGGPGGVVTSQSTVQTRLAILQELSTSPDVSQATREWSRLVLEMLTEAV